MLEVLYESTLKSLPLVARGKVRDIYAVGDDRLLIVTTDRLSAFDVILPDPIPGKGAVLTAVSNFWFRFTERIIPNHLSDTPLAEVLPDPAERGEVEGRAIVVRKMKALPVEAIVRGYLIGSGWKDYQQSGSVCGIALPPGLRQADRLPEVIFTPSNKAASGEHDVNVDFESVAGLIGAELARQVRDVSIRIYELAVEHALGCGIIIADTKFEFGLDASGELVLADEVLTPDSSRFWPADRYGPGKSQPSFDKQFVRDYLESIGWNKQPPVPELPDRIVDGTRERYLEIFRILTGENLA